MFDEDWNRRREGDEFAPSGGKVPILWDDKTVIWDSLAIIEWLADKTDRARYWPTEDAARSEERRVGKECVSTVSISVVAVSLKKKNREKLTAEVLTKNHTNK